MLLIVEASPLTDFGPKEIEVLSLFVQHIRVLIG